MQPHIRIYRKFFDIGDQDQTPPCEYCGNLGNEIHHIHRRGLKGFEENGKHYDINDILNLILLCRKCHEKAHGGGITKGELLLAHKYKILNKKFGYVQK